MNGELRAFVATPCPKKAFGGAIYRCPSLSAPGSAGKGTLDIHRARARTRAPGAWPFLQLPDARQHPFASRARVEITALAAIWHGNHELKSHFSSEPPFRWILNRELRRRNGDVNCSLRRLLEPGTDQPQHRPLPPQSPRPPCQTVRRSPPRPDQPLTRLQLWAGRRHHRRVQELWSLTSSIPLCPYIGCSRGRLAARVNSGM
jgi:hypothetical protein